MTDERNSCAGWVTYECSECGFRWIDYVRDALSPSGTDCAANCGAYPGTSRPFPHPEKLIPETKHTVMSQDGPPDEPEPEETADKKPARGLGRPLVPRDSADRVEPVNPFFDPTGQIIHRMKSTKTKSDP